MFSERSPLRAGGKSIGLVNDDRVVPGGISQSIYKRHLEREKVVINYTPKPKPPSPPSSPESYHVSGQGQRAQKKLYRRSPRRYGQLSRRFGLNHYYSEESDETAENADLELERFKQRTVAPAKSGKLLPKGHMSQMPSMLNMQGGLNISASNLGLA